MKVKVLQCMVMGALLMGIQVSGVYDVNAADQKQATATKTGRAAGTTAVKPATKSVVKSPVKTVNRGNKTTYRPLAVKPVSTASKPSVASTSVAAKPVSTATTAKPSSSKITGKPVAADKAAVKTATDKVSEKKERMPDVRVLLGSRKQDAVITSSAALRIVNSTGSQTGTVGANKKTTVGIKGNKIAVNGKAVDTAVTLKPADGTAPFLFEGKGYRGGLTLRANNGTMMVINTVPLEEYLYGVVAQEAIPSWPAAALEAQAVAARTYALHTMERNKGKLYDVSPTTDHQVYSGVRGEVHSTTAAVNKTKGVVMLYKDHPINAMFHADGGGHTEDSVNVWGNDVPYLKGVKDFSKTGDSSGWTVTTSRQALEGKLNAASKGVGKLKSIQLTPLGKPGKQTADRGVSGRVKTATFVGTSGRVTLSGDDLRGILGLKSTLFDFYVNHKPGAPGGKAYHTFTGKNDAVYIKGYGWGHGLGLSQWGAAEMAKQAKPGDPDFYQTILKHYYSGITLKKMY